MRTRRSRDEQHEESDRALNAKPAAAFRVHFAGSERNVPDGLVSWPKPPPEPKPIEGPPTAHKATMEEGKRLPSVPSIFVIVA